MFMSRPIADQCCQQGRPAVTKQGQGYADDRQEAHDHQQVDDRLPENKHHETEGQQDAELVAGRQGYVNPPEQHKEITAQKKNTAGKTPFLGPDGKGEIGMPFREKMEMPLGPFHKSLAENLPAADRNF